MTRSVFTTAFWLIPALFLAACASTSNSPEEVKQSPGNNGDTGSSGEAVSESPPTQGGESTPSPTDAANPAPLPATAAPQLSLPDLGPAPDIRNEVWLNTDQPLDLAVLRGQVVLIEFWTFG